MIIAINRDSISSFEKSPKRTRLESSTARVNVEQYLMSNLWRRRRPFRFFPRNPSTLAPRKTTWVCWPTRPSATAPWQACSSGTTTVFARWCTSPPPFSSACWRTTVSVHVSHGRVDIIRGFFLLLFSAFFSIFRNLFLRERSAPRAGQRPAERQHRIAIPGPLQGADGRSAILRDGNAALILDLQVQKLAAGNVFAQFHFELSSKKEHGENCQWTVVGVTQTSSLSSFI